MSSAGAADIFSRQNLIAALCMGGAGYLAVRFLVPAEAAAPWLSQHAITVALTLGVTSVLVDQFLPRVDSFLQQYQL